MQLIRIDTEKVRKSTYTHPSGPSISGHAELGYESPWSRSNTAYLGSARRFITQKLVVLDEDLMFNSLECPVQINFLGDSDEDDYYSPNAKVNWRVFTECVTPELRRYLNGEILENSMEWYFKNTRPSVSSKYKDSIGSLKYNHFEFSLVVDLSNFSEIDRNKVINFYLEGNGYSEVSVESVPMYKDDIMVEVPALVAEHKRLSKSDLFYVE